MISGRSRSKQLACCTRSDDRSPTAACCCHCASSQGLLRQNGCRTASPVQHRVDWRTIAALCCLLLPAPACSPWSPISMRLPLPLHRALLLLHMLLPAWSPRRGVLPFLPASGRAHEAFATATRAPHHRTGVAAVAVLLARRLLEHAANGRANSQCVPATAPTRPKPSRRRPTSSGTLMGCRGT